MISDGENVLWVEVEERDGFLADGVSYHKWGTSEELQHRKDQWNVLDVLYDQWKSGEEEEERRMNIKGGRKKEEGGGGERRKRKVSKMRRRW